MSNRRVWLDGTLVPWDEARVSALSHAMQRGSLVFDVGAFHPHAQTGRAALFRLREHVTRFFRSASIVGLAIAHDPIALEQATLQTVRTNGLAQGLVRWSAFFPHPESDVVPRSDAARVVIAVYDPVDLGTKRPKPEALRVRIPPDARKASPDAIPPLAKVAAAYLGPSLAKRRALADGYDEVVLLDSRGRLAEAPTANVFAVRDRTLMTPPLENVLDGITRDSVLALARAEGIAVREEHMMADELATADEAFLTGTSLPIAPIGSVDGRPVGNGGVGPTTARLRSLLERCERGDDPRFPHWVTSA
jgi:branched-chain amino acid aminotransferase